MGSKLPDLAQSSRTSASSKLASLFRHTRVSVTFDLLLVARFFPGRNRSVTHHPDEHLFSIGNLLCGLSPGYYSDVEVRAF